MRLFSFFALALPLSASAAPAACPAVATAWARDIVHADSAVQESGEGRGAKVAVIDTGIDAGNPAFRNVHIVGADFVGGTDSVPYPYFDRDGHGTHVAGIIAGLDCAGHPLGLAPNADLYVARVCGEEGCKSQDVAKGVEWAIAQKVDAINISIEGDAAHTSPEEVAAVTKAIAQGIVVVTISGNGGDSAEDNTDSAIPGVITVGAINKWGERPFFSHVGGETLAAPGVNILSAYPRGTGYVLQGQAHLNGKPYAPDLIALLGAPLPSGDGVSAPLAFAGSGTTEEINQAKVSGRIAVAQYNSSAATFHSMITDAEQAGAQALLVMLEHSTFATGLETLDTVTIPVLMVPVDEKPSLQALAQAGGNLTVTSPKADYVVESGTSMAAPFVTGAVALLKSKNHGLAAERIKNILADSATHSGDPNDSPLEDSPFGAGILNVSAALKLAE